MTTTSILLRSPTMHTPSHSPSPASTPLPALQPDLSSSSSASGSCLDLRRTTSSRSRRIRFAPLPEPDRDLLDPLHVSSDDPQPGEKSPASAQNDMHDGFVALSPSISPDSTLSSARSTPTIRTSNPAKNSPKSGLKLLRSFLRRPNISSSNSSLVQSPSRTGSFSSLPGQASSSLPNSPSFPVKLSRISTDDILTLGTKSLFRARSGSEVSSRSSRPSSPPPKASDPKSRFRSATVSSGPSLTLGSEKRDWGEGSSQAQHIPTEGSDLKRRPSSATSPGAGGGRHVSSTKMFTNELSPRPSTAPSLSSAHPKKHVKMLNGRIYGAKRYAAQTLANPFANVRDEPEFVEWGYGGMGSVQASAGIANDMWKGLQRSERGGAFFADSSFSSDAVPTSGRRGSDARAASPIARRKMSDNVPECGMGNVGHGVDEDDGSGMAWVKKRRAEREAKALEEAARELEKKTREGRKSGESMDASMYASTASTTTSLTACTSAASTDLTTPTTSPFTSRSSSVTELKLKSPPPLDSGDLRGTPSRDQLANSDTPVQPAPSLRSEHKHHVLTAVVLSPSISTSPHKHDHTHRHTLSLSRPLSHMNIGGESTEQLAPLSPVETDETSASTNSNGEDDEEQSRCPEEEEHDVDEDEVQDTRRKTALGAGIEKVSRHVNIEAR